jgi:hypothetical protein
MPVACIFVNYIAVKYANAEQTKVNVTEYYDFVSIVFKIHQKKIVFLSPGTVEARFEPSNLGSRVGCSAIAPAKTAGLS